MKRKHYRKNRFISSNADNRHFCLEIQRQKFCYETEAKAKLACKFSDNPQRIYYCESCCAYHTTHMDKEIYDNSYARMRNERMQKQLDEAKLITDDRKSKRIIDKNYIKKINQETNTIERFIGCCRAYQLKSIVDDQLLSKEELAELIYFDNTKALFSFRKTVESGLQAKRYFLEAYILYKLAGDGLAYDSIGEMIADNFVGLSMTEQKKIQTFLMSLYNAGIIYTKLENETKIYYLNTEITEKEINKLDKDNKKYFVITDK